MQCYLFAILLLTAAITEAKVPPYQGPHPTAFVQNITIGTFVSGEYSDAVLFYPADYKKQPLGSIPLISFAHGMTSGGERVFPIYSEYLDTLAS